MRVLRATDSLLIEVWFSTDTEDCHPKIRLRPLTGPADGCIPLHPNEVDDLIAALTEASALIEGDQQVI